MTPDRVLGDVKKGALLPVYLVVGEEHVLARRVTQALLERALAGAIADFNCDKLTAGDASIDAVLSACKMLPMMAERRVVMVSGLERWDGAKDDEDAKKLSPLDRLVEYADAPNPTTTLILVAGKLDGRRKLSTVAKKKDFVVNCEPLARADLSRWVARRFQEEGHAIDRDWVELLVELLGPDLGPVEDAIERLSLYVGAGAPVTDQAIRECITRVRLSDTWALVEALRKKKLATALATFRDAYDPRDRGLPMLGAIAWSTRQTLKFVLALRAGFPEGEAAKRAGVFQPFRAQELARQAKTFDARELERWLTLLAEADLQLKGSKLPPDLVLENMLMRMCA